MNENHTKHKKNSDCRHVDANTEGQKPNCEKAENVLCDVLP